MENEKKFVTGLWIETKHTQYGEVIKQSIKVDDFIKFLNENRNEKGYVNIDILNKRDGGKYAKLNEYKPNTNNLPPC